MTIEEKNFCLDFDSKLKLFEIYKDIQHKFSMENQIRFDYLCNWLLDNMIKYYELIK